MTRLGPGREVRPAVGRRPCCGVGAGNAVAEQHGAEGQAGEAHAGVGEEGTARDAAAWLSAGC